MVRMCYATNVFSFCEMLGCICIGAGVPLVKTPSDMQAKLFPHQVIGLSWLYSHEYHNREYIA